MSDAAFDDQWSDRSPVRRALKLPEVVARRVVREIADRNLTPGERLPPEAIMSTSYGVGRATVREALRVLEVHGLITMKTGPNGGPYVAEMSSDDFGRTMSLFMEAKGLTFGELIEARLLIEPPMARLAAQRATPETAGLLRGLVDSAKKIPAGAQAVAAHLEFHHAVIRCSGNGLLSLIVNGIEDIYIGHRVAVRDPVDARDDVTRTCREHEEIAEAIARRAPGIAERRMREHLEGLAANVREGKDRWLLEEVVRWERPSRPAKPG